MGLADVFTDFKIKLISGILIPQVDEHLNFVAEKARETAPTRKIASAIGVDSAYVDNDGSIVGNIFVDLEIAPEGAAYEFGSGIHSTIGDRQKYPILPRNKKALAFFWDKADPSRHRILPDGRVLLMRVAHPGVEAQPYLDPAFKDQQGINFLRQKLFDGMSVQLSSSFQANLNKNI